MGKIKVNWEGYFSVHPEVPIFFFSRDWVRLINIPCCCERVTSLLHIESVTFPATASTNSYTGVDPGMGRSTPPPPILTAKSCNSAYFGVISANFPPISTLGPLFLQTWIRPCIHIGWEEQVRVECPAQGHNMKGGPHMAWIHNPEILGLELYHWATCTSTM